MTPEEIHDLKTELGKVISARMDEAFLGQSVADVSAEVVKSYLSSIMKDFLAKGAHSVVDLVDYDVVFVGNVMNVTMQPKKGLSNEDHERAVRFLFNEEFY